jgi:hypothetical protein
MMSYHDLWQLDKMAVWLSHRRRIALALSLFLVWTTYYLWAGEHESLITTSRKWGQPKNSTTDTNLIQENKNDYDYNNDDYHYALHTKIYTPAAAAPKSTNIDNEHPEDYDNHFALHTKTFAQTATADVQATPVHTADGGPTATLIPDEFDENPIRELCAQTSWALSKDVVINCGGRRVGGVGMLRSHPLHSKIRYLTDSFYRRQYTTRNPGVCQTRYRNWS